MDIINIKKRYIKHLSIAKNAFDAVNEVTDKGYFTFYTPAGIIMGKIIDVEPFPFEDQSDFVDKFAQASEDGKPVSVYELAAGLQDKFLDALDKEYETKLVSDNKAIHLEDVTIIDVNKNITEINTFVLFVDQVIGIVPAKLNFNN
ncbi:hypothetical protein [Metabacillus fastidiosus]|uniref:Uncharacterized protein n=1 Tax=Metabacillus fastidiosus TaxID=1458 RepID=A0ABU6NT69_9BACI|nr:hypothetical protein [Metabacillus fastidiosus]